MSQSCGPNPGDRQVMITVLRQAVDLGITFIDTAESYGPYVNEELVGEALQPIRDQVTIATKFGWRIEDGKSVGLDSRPEHIKQVADDALRRLRTDVIRPMCQALNREGSVQAACGLESIRQVGHSTRHLITARSGRCRPPAARAPESGQHRQEFLAGWG